MANHWAWPPCLHLVALGRRVSLGCLVPLLALAAVLALAPGPAEARVEVDLPARIGRLTPLQGEVSVLDADSGNWVAASHNLPVSSGDRVTTAAGARAALRIGSTVLRLAGASELEVRRIDDASMVFELHRGSLALSVRSDAVAAEISVLTGEASLRLLRSGNYRVDRHDVTTLAASERGELQVDDDGGWRVGSGSRVEIWRAGSGRELRQAWAARANDEFASWLASADRDDDYVASSPHVSPEMTGAEDLDRHGRWDRHPEHGVVWLPHTVPVGWAPYRHGRWAWVRPWGWTWVDAAPWGFAPFHYGRWVSWGGRWCWSPGPPVARPVYAPALVRWVSAPPPHWHGVRQHPGVGWVPLAPHETFVPLRPAAPPVTDQRRRPPPPSRPAMASVFLPPAAAVPAAPPGVGPQRPVTWPTTAQTAPRLTPRPMPPVMPAQTTASVTTPMPRPVIPPASPNPPALPTPQARPGAMVSPGPAPTVATAATPSTTPTAHQRPFHPGVDVHDGTSRIPEPRGRAPMRQAER
jgi:hypothetical protein